MPESGALNFQRKRRQSSAPSLKLRPLETVVHDSVWYQRAKCRHHPTQIFTMGNIIPNIMEIIKIRHIFPPLPLRLPLFINLTIITIITMKIRLFRANILPGPRGLIKTIFTGLIRDRRQVRISKLVPWVGRETRGHLQTFLIQLNRGKCLFLDYSQGQ